MRCYYTARWCNLYSGMSLTEIPQRNLSEAFNTKLNTKLLDQNAVDSSSLLLQTAVLAFFNKQPKIIFREFNLTLLLLSVFLINKDVEHEQSQQVHQYTTHTHLHSKQFAKKNHHLHKLVR